MPPQPPRPALDLLVVGGLTVDRFADGSTAPGGSVLYAARAAAAVVRRVGAVVSAGSEPEAEAGLRELRALKFLHVERVARSISFAHAGDGARRLVFGASGGRFSAPQAPAAAAVL
ncbi:MAG TPA: hypothetical protein VHK63_01075, partial [Candidatus Limnocylindria bacterium]|nr:hypothetical protein [Candidatus Limnocylindria bacterium]